MKVHRYSEHQRRLWVHEMVHKTKTIKAICTEAEISRATLYNWQNELNETDRKAKEQEAVTASFSWQPNDKYKMLLAALLKVDTGKQTARKLAKELVKRYNLTIAQACSLVSLPEEAYKHRPRKPETDDKEVYAALVGLIAEKKSRSLEDCISVLMYAYPHWTVKQIKRIYRQGRLYLKRTRIRRLLLTPDAPAFTENNLPAYLSREGAFWHFGMVETELADDGAGWLLYILDYNDGTPLNGLCGDGILSEEDIMKLVLKAAAENGLPKKIRLPAVAPFNNRSLQKWCRENRAAIYNLSMVKPENRLEADYIADDIVKQLSIDGTTSLHLLKRATENWLQSFAQNSREAINYFAKEMVGEMTADR